VAFDRAFLNEQPLGNGCVRQAFGHQREHFAFARFQILDGIVKALACKQGSDQSLVDAYLARCNLTHDVDQLVHVLNTVLELVSDGRAK
jgi:hypothetical protein